MNILAYLTFRRSVVAIDEWLSYFLLVLLYYYFKEQRLWVLFPIILMIIAFNMTGYYYLALLETHFQIYGPGPIWPDQLVNTTFNGPKYLIPPGF